VGGNMDVRTEILQVSLKLFNEFGSENISTNEIAKKTDISTGTLYYYFKNKEEIIVELFIKMNKEYDDKFNKQIDFVRGFNRDIILIDDSDFLEEYSFFSKEANILIKNDDIL
jgi:AcrR family transcriptional regulator